MREFEIAIRSFDEVQAFVALAMVQPFRVVVGNDRQQINGKSFIGMFSLDYSRPIRVSTDCGEEEFLRFQQETARLLA